MTTPQTPPTDTLTVDQALQQAITNHKAGNLQVAERLSIVPYLKPCPATLTPTTTLVCWNSWIKAQAVRWQYRMKPPVSAANCGRVHDGYELSTVFCADKRTLRRRHTTQGHHGDQSLGRHGRTYPLYDTHGSYCLDHRLDR